MSDHQNDVRIEDWRRRRRRRSRKSQNHKKARSIRDDGDDDADEPDVDLEDLEIGTIEHACQVIGGKGSPVHPVTYYRGAAAGRYNKPFHPSPGISRVNLKILRQMIQRAADEEAR